MEKYSGPAYDPVLQLYLVLLNKEQFIGERPLTVITLGSLAELGNHRLVPHAAFLDQSKVSMLVRRPE